MKAGANGTSVEIIKKGNWFRREYQVQSEAGQKLYSIREEVDERSSRAILHDAGAEEIGSLSAGIGGISFLYRAKLRGGEEEKIEIRHKNGKKIYELSRYGLRLEKKMFACQYDIFGGNNRKGRLFSKAGRYILELENERGESEGKDLLVQMLFLFMTVKESECAC